MNKKIFLSVGKAINEKQEIFISAIENRLMNEGFIPCTVGRSNFSSDMPLKLVGKLMNECSGTVVIALERTFYLSGLERNGLDRETIIEKIKLPTPWNQIEAAMAYCHNHPLLVIVENGIKSEGLLEKGHDWYVQWVNITPESLLTKEFNGVLEDWKRKVLYKDKGFSVAVEI